jgi:alkanesulfonate monooxygenase
LFISLQKIDTLLIYINANANKSEICKWLYTEKRPILKRHGGSMSIVPITSPDLNAAEVSWFSALCSDDYRYLGVPDGSLRSSWDHCSAIVKTAEDMGFRNILCPSSYQVGQDTLSFVAGCAPITSKINLLAAVRCGEMQPIMLARTIATLDHMLEGRLTVNIISSDFPGEQADSGFRYKRSHEVVEILRQAWTRDEINFEGEIYNFKGVKTDPARPYQQNGGPLLYFGGYSPDALELCGTQCDVYLMWPETREELAGRMKAVNERAAAHDRTLDYGLRVHMIVRDTEAEAKEYARELVSKLDDEQGKAIRDRALDSKSLGVSHQAKNREIADLEGFIEPHLWTGVGRARSGCGAALVGSTDQVMSEIEAYQKMGIRAFIFSGYPHIDECLSFGKRVLPNLKTCSLPHEYGRVPASTPATPLGIGERR